MALLLSAGLSLFSAVLVEHAVEAGQRLDAARHGRMVVERAFLPEARAGACRGGAADRTGSCRLEAAQLARLNGEDPALVERRLRAAAAAAAAAPDRIVALDRAVPGLAALPMDGAAGLLGTLALFWWILMLLAHGEGLELDTQRRRHPHWEWVLFHPVRSGALFTAEMLAPLAANPVYWGVPLFPAILFADTYGFGAGCASLVVVGLPAALAAAFASKAIEIAITLRLAPSRRGAAFGLLGWIGYATAVFTFLLSSRVGGLADALSRPIDAAAAVVRAPVLGTLLGRIGGAPPSFVAGVIICDAVAVAVVPAAIGLSVWGARRSIAGATDALSSPGRAPRRRAVPRFRRNPLLRKEWLWFARDRSALVQVVLIPFTLAALQLFNFHGLLASAADGSSTLNGAAILFGTYFLLVLGPKSLASEGPALWISATWPHGLETMLRAKARLWTMLSTALVAVPLAASAWLFPSDAPATGLVGLGWMLFAFGMAAKAVTLATVPRPSGEPEPIPRSRQMATWLGTLTFSVGVLTRQWPMAVAGIVASNIAGAAMWQNFRARLPYLFDPWSERAPVPPTVLHALVAVAVLIDGGAVVTGVGLVLGGLHRAIEARTVGYTAAAIAVAVGTTLFLRRNGVAPATLWRWPAADEPAAADGPTADGRSTRRPLLLLVSAALVAGAALGGVAHLYLAALHAWPWARRTLEAPTPFAGLPDARALLFGLAVLVAPPVEEFLFRGLLFRALEREWGLWPAIGGSTAFFAIYHPVPSWLPVSVVGAVNALLFRRSGVLLPAVALHAAYNAVVLI